MTLPDPSQKDIDAAVAVLSRYGRAADAHTEGVAELAVALGVLRTRCIDHERC
ncbi:hypothetical protein ACGFZL_31725 [Streptomyces sp. NPDC048182]|uniref:hypothetical protein n=1 Tax=Streptomyces sp. NPDC048182 TaxID=3365507 RepID=UPI0037146089